MAKISIKQKVDEKLIPLRRLNGEQKVVIQSLKAYNENLLVENITLKADIAILKDWIERLLEYTKMSEKDLKEIVKSAKKTNEVRESLSGLFEVFKLLGNY